MKFTMKKTMVAAAIAAMAMSGAANAAMNVTAGALGGDSSLILTLLDSTAGVSATFDLGFNKSTFNTAANSSWNINSGNYTSAWDSFFAAGATAANTQYSVFAGDATGTAVGSQSLFTTSAIAVLPTVTGTSLSNMQGVFDTYILANNALGNHGAVADGASFVTAATGGNAYAGVGVAYGTAGKIGNIGGDTNAVLGTDMNVWNIVRASTNNITNATATKLSVAGFNPYFSMADTGALTYTASVAAVPEADTYAMFLAGLGLMGFIARRRMSV